jgi:5'-nucleotidase
MRVVALIAVALVLPACGGGDGDPAAPVVYTIPPGAIGVATSVFPHTLTDMGTRETALGDLVADAMRIRYGTQISFQNGWGIRSTLPAPVLPADPTLRRPDAGYAPGPPYDLVAQDLGFMLPFGNTVITRTVTGTQLWAMMELGFGPYPNNNNGFPQISGFTVTFKASNAAGSRVLSIVLDGGAAVLNNAATYTFATNNFINAGGDGYAMLNDGQGTVREVLADVVADHIGNLGAITPSIAGRIVVVP